LQPRIRTHDDDTDRRGGRHATAGCGEVPRVPTTIPITLAAMTYGRHAADEGWGALPPRTRTPAWRVAWRRVHDLARRLAARTPGDPA
jgi:hypothetical protein